MKPWLDRSLLFVLSRAVFGSDARHRPVAGAAHGRWQQLPSTLSWQRLSPWRSFTQAIYQLEGQRGTARRQRREQLLHKQRGAAGGMHIAFAHVEAALMMGLLALAFWFAPDNLRDEVFSWLTGEDNIAATVCLAVAYAAAVAVLEPFYVAAGFAMYLNRRVQLEAWDIEQEFRRAF